MKPGKKILLIFSVVIYSCGVILGMAITGLTMWGDLEASLYDSFINYEGRQRLSCPVMISSSETGTVSTTTKNPSDKPIKSRVVLRTTEGFISMMREERDFRDLAPGESYDLEWIVNPEDAVYGGLLILVKVRTDLTYPLTDRQASCGIIVVNSQGFSGVQIFIFAVVASLVFMALGITILGVNNQPLIGKPNKVFRAMLALATLILLGMLSGLFGWWVVGAVIFIVGILLIGAIIAYFIDQ